MEMHPLDWAIVAAYALFAVGVGLAFARRASRSVGDFFLSGRNLPWWVVGTSMVATTFAADTPLAVTEYVRTEGIWRNWFWWSMGVGHVVAIFLFSRLWRRASVVTDAELTEIRYAGRNAALLRGFKACFFAVFLNVLIMGWVTAAMSSVLKAILPIDTATAIAVSAAIAIFYSVASGFWGVVVTDLVQFVMAMVGFVLFAVLAAKGVGGLEALQAKVAAVGGHTLDLLPPASDAPLWSAAMLHTPRFKVLVFLLVMWWSTHNADGGGYMIQRMSAAKDERHAMFGTLWFAVAHYALRMWPWIVVALASVVVRPDMTDHKAAFQALMAVYLPVGLRGLMVASFLAAFMSTIDTHLNWGASYLVNDLYRRFFRPEASERHYVAVARLCMLGLTALAGLVASQVESISGAWEFVFALGAGLGLVLVLRWLWWRVTALSELAGLSTSLVLTLALAPLELPVQIKLLIIVPVSVCVWVTVTLLRPPEPMETLMAFFRRIRPPGLWGPVRAALEARGEEVPPSGFGPGLLLDLAAGLAAVYGGLFGLGNLLFGRAPQAAALLCLAAAGLAVVWWRHVRGGSARAQKA